MLFLLSSKSLPSQSQGGPAEILGGEVGPVTEGVSSRWMGSQTGKLRAAGLPASAALK